MTSWRYGDNYNILCLYQILGTASACSGLRHRKFLFYSATFLRLKRLELLLFVIEL